METQPLAPGKKRAILTVAAIASFLTPFMGSAVNVILPSLGEEFGLDAIRLSWVATSYFLAAAVFLVPLGKVADMYGRSRVFVYGIGLYTIASAVAGFASNGDILIAARVFQGIGGSMVFGTNMALVTTIFPPGERGRAIGFLVAAVYSGLSLGPVLGGFMTAAWGWRSVFLLNIPLGAFIIFLARGGMGETRGAGKQEGPFDFAGSIIYALSIFSALFGLSRLPSPAGAALLIASVAGFGLLVRREHDAANPVLETDLILRNPAFAFSNLAALINYSANAATGFLLNLQLQYVLGLSPGRAGLVLVCQPVVMALGSPLAGRLSDRVEPRVLASIGMAISSLGLLVLAFLTEATPLAWIISALFVLGLGFSLFSSPNTNAVMSSVGPKDYGVAAATVSTMRLIGQAFSMSVVTLSLNLFVGAERITPALFEKLTASLRTSFAFFSALCFLGVFASLARGRIRSKP